MGEVRLVELDLPVSSAAETYFGDRNGPSAGGSMIFTGANGEDIYARTVYDRGRLDVGRTALNVQVALGDEPTEGYPAAAQYLTGLIRGRSGGL